MKTGLQNMPEYIMVTKYKEQNRILKDCIKVLIRWADREILEDIAKMKIDDSDNACDSYKKDFTKIVECLTANPDLQII